jgi:competence protein ComEA
VNLSSEEDLTLIPGIGMKTAKAIISYRDKNNGIKDLQELTAVKGIGKKRLRLLMSYLTIEE